MAELTPEVRKLFDGRRGARGDRPPVAQVHRPAVPMRSGVVYEVEPERVSFMELPFEHSPTA